MLLVGNSTSRVDGLTPEQFKGLREELSYRLPPQVFGGGHHSTKRYLLTKRGDFPTGLLPYVQRYLTEKRIYGALKDTRVKPVSRLGTFHLAFPEGLEPYPEQFEAVLRATEAHRGTIAAVTAFGKSIMMAMLVQCLQVRTLIVVPNLGLKRQLQDTFRALFGSLRYVTIENIDSPALEKDGAYDLLIIDEAHHVAAKTYRRLNAHMWTGIYYRFFFTGTPFRSRDEEQLLMESVAGQVIYRIGYKEAVKLGAITPVEAYYIDLPKIPTDAYTWQEVYKELVVNRKDRNLEIQNVITSLHMLGKSTLCLVKEISHGKKLTCDEAFAFANGTDKTTADMIQRFNSRDPRMFVLVGTNGILGEGVDTKPCEFVIIAGLGKSKNAFMQQVGRALRKYPGKQTAKIILIRDPSHKFTLAHFNAQRRILREEYGVEPVRLET